MKKIKLLGLIVAIALIYLIFTGTTNRKNEITPNQNINLPNNIVNIGKENVEKVINNGGSVLKYNGYLYYVSAKNTEDEGFNNALYRKNLKDGKEELLFDGERYRIENRLIIFNNNIFFSMVGQTYYINIENPYKISEYNDGILYTIGDGNLIYAYNNNLFKATYYEKTLAIKSITTIATLDPNFMFEDEENLYFYSLNEDNSISIINVNKKSQTVNILDRIYSKTNNKIEVENFKDFNDYIYITLKNEQYETIKISKKENESEVLNISEKPSEMLYTNNDFYLKKSGKNISLYKNEEKIVTILRDIDETLNNIVIEYIEDILYIRFDLNEGQKRNIMFWKVNKDGSNLERINL